jgi:NAD+ diphosphatase
VWDSAAVTDVIPFAGATIDRAAERRGDEAWLAAARADPQARAVLVGMEGATATPVPLDAQEPLALLGVDADDAPVFVAAAPDDTELTPLRMLAANADAATAGLVAYAAALANFHRLHRFCARCGEPTEPREAGFSRICPNDHTTFPRTDPVVIMLVIDAPKDRVLLGRQPMWPPRRYSALAGFVEPGESLEAAVAREVAEEAGLVVGDVRYVASQPWPFPGSLMLGFHADYVSGEPHALDHELDDVRWFTREEVAAAGGYDVDFLGGGAPEDDSLILPPRLAIARHLVERWLR